MQMNDPFGRSTLPADFDREHRVRLIGEAATALLDGRLPDAPARLFLAGALLAWLQDGKRIGDLERRYLRVAAPRASRRTASELWRRARLIAMSDSGEHDAHDDANDGGATS